MKRRVKTALGIDIGESGINAVLIKSGAKGFSVVEASHIALPEGTIEQGRVADSVALLTALKTLRTRCSARAGRVALSLPTRGALARVVPLEATDPQEIGAFVTGEVRQYAAFSGRETVSDYRVLTPATQHSRGKVFVATADRKSVATLVELCRRAGLQVSTVEPVTSACTRVLALTKTQDWVVLALRKDGMLSLCVSQGGMLDFIRSKACNRPDADGIEWMAEEIKVVVEFCRSQRRGAAEVCRVLVVDDDGTNIAPQVWRDIATEMRDVEVQFCTRETVPVLQAVQGEHASVLSIPAFGLALRLLEPDSDGTCVNLLPSEATHADQAKRRMLLAANVLAAMVPMMVMIAGGLNYMAERYHRDVLEMRRDALERGDRTLPVAVDQLQSVAGRIKVLDSELACLKSGWEAQGAVDWSGLLKEITSVVPSAVCITELSQEGPQEIRIEGVSRSNEAVDVFVEMLDRSDLIERAFLLRKMSARSDENVIDYTIRCRAVVKGT